MIQLTFKVTNPVISDSDTFYLYLVDETTGEKTTLISNDEVDISEDSVYTFVFDEIIENKKLRMESSDKVNVSAYIKFIK